MGSLTLGMALSVILFSNQPGIAQGGITPEILDQLPQLPGELAPLPAVAVPKDNPQTPEKIELGKLLYFEKRLSRDFSMSCATCHHPDKGYADGHALGPGFGGKPLGRHSPTTLNTAFNQPQFWDGRATGLEEQAGGPMLAAGEMNMGTPELVISRLKAIPGYQSRFQKVFGKNSITFANVKKAIASFERTLITRDSRFERYLKGNKSALSKQEKRGLGLFIGKAQCTQCHSGANLTDNQFHNIGVPGKDAGRFAVTKKAKDKGAFKTPTLHHITETAPYMHDGSLKTLEEVVDFYNKGGGKSESKSDLIMPLELTDQEKKDLLAFLKTLKAKVPQLKAPAAP